MIGEQYWATGIILRPGVNGDDVRWSARLKFYDDGWAEDSSTEGELHTRYFGADLAQAIDTVRADAAKLGIVFRMHPAPFLSIEGDGQSKDWPPPPDWRKILVAQAARIGFFTYEPTEQVQDAA